jgi:hypothetical protein
VFVCEGEEELGNPRLKAFCDVHRSARPSRARALERLVESRISRR